MSMNHKERMLKAARGEKVDHLPWAPRIDLWYKANSHRGTLPSKYRPGVAIDEIADDIGGAYHKVVPEFRRDSRRMTSTGASGFSTSGKGSTAPNS